MGLRINTNITSIAALRNLKLTDDRQIKNLERLSTGLRINRASDDPSGLVISEILRSQLASIKQAIENSNNDANLVSTTEAALSETSTLLIKIRESIIFALNTGGTTPEQIAAEQDAVDSAISALKRIADASRFGDRQLLNGASSFNIISQTISQILDVKPLSVQFDPASQVTTFNLNILSIASQATALAARSALAGTPTASGGDVIIRIRGPLGAVEITLASGTTNTEFQNSINVLRGNTGIYASGGYLYTEDFGSDALITIEQIGGTGRFTGGPLTGTGIPLLGRFVDAGADAVATLGGVRAAARGNNLQIVTTLFTGSIVLNPATNQDPIRGAGGVGTASFSIQNSGLQFQFGTAANPNEQKIIGLPNVDPSFLGNPPVIIGGVVFNGNLTTLLSGGANDLFSNPGRALQIVDDALEEILDARSFLGAFVEQTIEPNIRTLSVALENLSASESDIRDLDFAEGVAEMTRNQIIFQAGISVLAQANLVPQSVLQLLQI